jgi:soluble lytic murein transglycosylase-like protein
VALTKAGLYVAARKDLEVRARAGRLNPDGQTLLASLTLRTQPPSLPDSIIRWRGRLPDYPNPHNQRLWKYAYPLPYWDLIERFSAEWGLDPFLALALIRHESRYNANAVSPARAVGLMQILPTTAGSVARRLLNEPRPSARALKQPERNIRLGTRLVQELMSLFSNNEALVLAAYNAGSGRTRGWLRRANEQGISDVDVFVEEIPFRQTHGYVKAVLATYGVYRYLYGSRERPAHRSIPLETVLPESLGPYFRR